jgi:Scaffold domain
MLRYLRDLHLGRVDPRTLGLSLRVSPERHDFVGVLRSTLANHRIVDLPTELAPPLGQYRALRAALAEYRAWRVLRVCPRFRSQSKRFGRVTGTVRSTRCFAS